MYTVKQLAKLAGVSVRTLHYYDEIGLLRPSDVGENGYRHYDDGALLRLQQILFYRELDLKLADIRRLIDDPAFDAVTALRAHRAALDRKMTRLHTLVHTIDTTIEHLTGAIPMSGKQVFQGFSEEQQAEYEKQAMELYDPDIVRDSNRRWKAYGKQKQQAIMAEAGAIYTDFVAAMDEGPGSATVQAIVAHWHENMRNFFEPTPEMLRGLGQHYNSNPDFMANFARFHPDLPAFLEQAITIYVDNLEDAA
ncbi:MAG: MerR family transcriptional regulator [Anaerolineae bacterium]|nr:MerR family transcriptional regulator [Anaerolineae bacterium]